MKKWLSMLLSLTILLSLTACGDDEPVVDDEAPAEDATVELTLGSWRTDDVGRMEALLTAYREVAPNVHITFQPTDPPKYNETLRKQLESGKGPDLMVARSYAAGAELYDAGYFADCTGLAGMEHFSDGAKAPWTAPDGALFAVPFAAVSHGVYYNQDVFVKEGLEIPQTWEEFLALCQTLKDKGYTPLANGLADKWDMLECFFLGMLPSFVGGAGERVKYETGEKQLDDPAFVAAYGAIAKVAPYLPNAFEKLTYHDSQVLFQTQQAAMIVDGSWNINLYAKADFRWGVFAIPGHTAEATAITFHPDMAITMNTQTEHPAEARAFLEWLATESGAAEASRDLPVGYFPMIDFDITLEDAHANEFLALNDGRETDVRFLWPVLTDLYDAMETAVVQVVKGEVNAVEAAASVAAAAVADAE